MPIASSILRAQTRSDSDGLIGITPQVHHAFVPCGFIPARRRREFYFYAFAIAGAWYVPPLTRIPHIGRAILLAKATPATLWGRFTVIDISQSSIFGLLRACFMIDVHRRSGAVRNGLSPGFEILPSRSFLRCSSQI